MPEHALLDIDDRRWFTIDEITNSVLANVVRSEARFQVFQAQAWRDFAAESRDDTWLPGSDVPEIVAGLGRLSNLGITELEVSIDVERRGDSWWERLWRFLVGLFGRRADAAKPQFRPRTGAGRGGLCLRIRVSRLSEGGWRASAEVPPHADVTDLRSPAA